MTIYEELNKLDHHLELPIGTTRSVIAGCDQTNLAILNNKLNKYGISIDMTTAVTQRCRQQWKKLMQELGISKAWWMDGDPDVVDLSSEIKKI